MVKNIERTVNGMDNMIDNARNAVVGASERAELGVGIAAEKVAEKAGYAAEMVAEKAQVVAGKAQEKVQAAGEMFRDGAECGARAAHQRIQQAADLVDRGYNRVRSDLSRGADVATEYIAENSGKAVLLAASAGFLLGMLATRRRFSPAI